MKVTRQFPLTLTAQLPFRSPLRGCSSNPGSAMSLGSIATFSRPRMSRSRPACFAFIPAVVPFRKKRSNPLCRNLRIATAKIVTCNVSGYKTRLTIRSSGRSAARAAAELKR